MPGTVRIRWTSASCGKGCGLLIQQPIPGDIVCGQGIARHGEGEDPPKVWGIALGRELKEHGARRVLAGGGDDIEGPPSWQRHPAGYTSSFRPPRRRVRPRRRSSAPGNPSPPGFLGGVKAEVIDLGGGGQGDGVVTEPQGRVVDEFRAICPPPTSPGGWGSRR